jgi:hypothetical protein
VRSPDYRRAVSRVDPLAFILIYLPRHVRGPETGHRITARVVRFPFPGHACRSATTLARV